MSAGQIPLTRNETARLLAALTHPGHSLWHRLRWPAWRRATSTAPGIATTSGKPASSEDHDLRLEY